MTPSRRQLLWLAMAVGAAVVACATTRAQGGAASASSPALKSPVDVFRELLAMPPEDRKQAIADRPAEDRKLILAKLREYESLKPDQRELRLRVTELHYYLKTLLASAETDRAAQLALLPTHVRQPVEARLRRWDRLKPAVQKDLLANEETLQLFVRLETSTAEERTNILAGISPKRRQWLEGEVARIKAMPEAERRELGERFNEFFDLTPAEKQKALQTLSEAERLQMERTLHQFEALTEAQRRHCIQAFQRFASMGLAERQQFLRNADRWRSMKPQERQAWRELVEKINELPPVPPGMDAAGSAQPPNP